MADVTKIVTFHTDGTTVTWSPNSTVVSPPINNTNPPVTPKPSPVPKPINNIGINLEPVNYYMGERPFNDLAKTMSPLLCKKVFTWDDGPAITSFDKNGWPTAIPEGCFVASVIDLKKGHPNTSYSFYAPNGDVVCDNQTGIGVFNKTTDEQRVLVRINKPVSFWSFKETDNKSSRTFSDSFIERNKKYSVLRFMDWAKTNYDREISWKTRVTKDWYTQGGKEVAIEYMIELCNETNTSPWYCIHHKSDDSFVRETAKLFKQQYKTGKPIYLEYSNEIWNSIFPQHAYCLARSAETSSPYEYSILRTSQIVKIFREEGVNVIGVLGAQCAGWGIMDWFLKNMTLPAEIDAIAIAPYFGYQISENAKKNVNLILDECDKNITLVSADIDQWVKLGVKLKKSIIGYEGGQHICPFPYEHGNQTIIDNYIQANRNPRMYDLYKKYLKSWDSITSKSLLCLFNSSQPFSKWGSWGLQEFESQSLQSAHKFRAVMDHISGK